MSDLLLLLCYGDVVDDDSHCKGYGQPAALLANPFVQFNGASSEDEPEGDRFATFRTTWGGHLGGSMPNSLASSAFNSRRLPNFIASRPTIRPMGVSLRK
jgi:hypothetical protein